MSSFSSSLWFQSVLVPFITDGTLFNFLQAIKTLTKQQSLSDTDLESNTSHITKEIDTRLQLVSQISPYCNYDSTKQQIALQLSDLISDKQSENQKSDPWLLRQKYLFIRTILRLYDKNEYHPSLCMKSTVDEVITRKNWFIHPIKESGILPRGLWVWNDELNSGGYR